MVNSVRIAWVALVSLTALISLMLVAASQAVTGKAMVAVPHVRPLTSIERQMILLEQQTRSVELSNYEIIDTLKNLPRGTTATQHGYQFDGKDGIRWSKKRDKGWGETR